MVLKDCIHKLIKYANSIAMLHKHFIYNHYKNTIKSSHLNDPLILIYRYKFKQFWQITVPLYSQAAGP